jgi:two-component system, chemotaxis family, CheB/CheR fusion protein
MPEIPVGLCILIVEDEPDVQEVVVQLLGHYGVNTDRATTAEEAVELLNQNSYDAALIDLALPGMNGFDLLKKIRAQAQWSGMRCIAFTAFHSAAVRKEVSDAGFNGYFAKPLDTHDFVQELVTIIKSGK